ncbi:hypothetical protein [Streptomyces sp. NPDC018947]|uniref:hypothetical protein n=1 Tax=Streptomyces sp. NPDC018947 TaxID=3365054 RepID=UPI0037B61BCB
MRHPPSAIDTFVRQASILDQQARPGKSGPVQPAGRDWQQDPLPSTLRDIGGCLAVILMGVLITLLVSAARDTWPLLGGISSSLVMYNSPQGKR